MKFRSLGLLRYGHFTDRVLEFPQDARVVVIHGDNEAGKTTALAAITDVLFGIELRSRYNFEHDYKSMRLAATLTGAQGRSLSFARLKRANATLVDPESNAALNDDILAPFLGAHDRQTFLDVFGLDQMRLREGGKRLLAGGGDLAASLLAAAPGLSEVSTLRDRMKESAAKIFNPQRKSASHDFYLAMERRDQARRAIRAEELLVDAVRTIREDADAAEKDRAEAEAAEREARIAVMQAQTLRSAAKELRVLDALLAKRSEIGPLPAVPGDFAVRAAEVLRNHEQAMLDAARAESEEASARAEFDAIAIDGAVLGLADEIEACDDARAAIQHELISLPKREGEASEARGELIAFARELGLPDIEALRAMAPGAPALARVADIVNRLHACEAQFQTLERARVALARRRKEIEADGDEGAHAADPAPFRQRLAALDGAEERERQFRVLDQKIASAQQPLRERVRRLGLGLHSVEEFLALPLPALSAADASLRTVRDALVQLARRKDEFDEIAGKLAQAEARLSTLIAGRQPPTEQAVAAARTHRDGAWQALRGVVLGERAAAPADQAEALQFERLIVDADRLADERLTEAARLADLAQTELAIAEAKARAASAYDRLTEANARLKAANAAWASLWPAGVIVPPDDDRGLELLREAAKIIEMRESIRDDEVARDSGREAVQWDRGEAARLRHDVGLPPLGDGPLRIAELRDAVHALEARFQAARDRDRDLVRLAKDEDDNAAAMRDLLAQREQVVGQAAALFPQLSIRAEASAEEAQAALGIWQAAGAALGKLGTAERRIEGIARDRALFEARLGDLLGRVAAPVEGDDFATAKHLRARLEAARRMQAQADVAREKLQRRVDALHEARSELRLCEAALAKVLELAGVSDAIALPALLERLREAAECEQAIAQAQSRLADIRGSRPVEELRAEIGERDDEALALAHAEAEAAQERARGAVAPAIERDTRAKAALADLDKRSGAAGAAQSEQDAIAEIADAMERFIRDHVASRLLSYAIERYRARHQNPIVERASQAFATLTCGRWSGLGIDYDLETPRLAAVRDQQMHGVDALSEGTADQLFLALRVAAIEDHAQRSTPLPFIADDLFVTFDERRTSAGFAVLGELGAVTQVIVFTHHDHVVACAQRTLQDQAAIIRL